MIAGAARPVPAAALAALALLAVAASLAGAGTLTGGAAGLLAALVLLAELRRMPRDAADGTTWCCFAAALALAAMPARSAAAVALLVIAASCLHVGPAGRAAAALLVALALAALADGGAGQLLAAPVLAIEAEAVRLLLCGVGVAGEAAGNTVVVTEAGRMLVILRGCSMLALLPPLLLTGLALARLIAPAQPLPAARLAIAAGVAVLLNLGRLGLMVMSDDAARFFHAPAGEALLQATWLALAAAAAWPVRETRR